MIQYEKKSLFDVTGKVILVHAVNCKGVMGSGIAKEFKARFPEAFEAYALDCFKQPLPGVSALYNTHNPDIKMGCLFTSDGYGKYVDDQETILKNTRLALDHFLLNCRSLPGFNVFSNKFNSGLFNVPWEKTEECIVRALKNHARITWTVCDPNLAAIV